MNYASTEKSSLKPSTAGIIHTAISGLEEVVNRLDDITNRYVGDVLQNPTPPKPQVVGIGGLIGEIYAAQDRISFLRDKIESCCDRLSAGL